MKCRITDPGSPFVSVIVPAFNAAGTLETTMGSVLDQTLEDFELIVVDDGSSDRTGDVVRRLACDDRRIIYLRKVNGGVASARNAGLAVACGEYVAFLDADDVWHPEFLERMSGSLASSPEKVAVAYCGSRIIDEKGMVIKSNPNPRQSGNVFGQMLVLNLIGNGSSMLLRRCVLTDELGRFDEELREAGLGGCEDLLLQLKLARKFEFVRTRGMLVGYRCVSNSMSDDGIRMVRSYEHVLRSFQTPATRRFIEWGLTRYLYSMAVGEVSNLRILRGLYLLKKSLFTSPILTVALIGELILFGIVRRIVARFRSGGVSSKSFFSCCPDEGEIQCRPVVSYLLTRASRFDPKSDYRETTQ
ncbi:glycosyltransferase family 2 protein [Alsobacter sp. SYSU BS001988]